ncbi:MAG: hypothetical protein KAV00_03415 [Phycisphaerae bacterium]|nr:hypothetical protein [Phycisphaerae bacterium]
MLSVSARFVLAALSLFLISGCVFFEVPEDVAVSTATKRIPWLLNEQYAQESAPGPGARVSPSEHFTSSFKSLDKAIKAGLKQVPGSKTKKETKDITQNYICVGRFLHITDAQVRDDRIYAKGKFKNQLLRLDTVLAPAIRNSYVYAFDSLIYASFLIGYGKYAKKQGNNGPNSVQPFVVDGGDLLDISVITELVETMNIRREIADKYKLQVYSIGGNHDGLTWGNLPDKPTKMRGLGVNKTEFVLGHLLADPVIDRGFGFGRNEIIQRFGLKNDTKLTDNDLREMFKDEGKKLVRLRDELVKIEEKLEKLEENLERHKVSREKYEFLLWLIKSRLWKSRLGKLYARSVHHETRDGYHKIVNICRMIEDIIRTEDKLHKERKAYFEVKKEAIRTTLAKTPPKGITKKDWKFICRQLGDIVDAAEERWQISNKLKPEERKWLLTHPIAFRKAIHTTSEGDRIGPECGYYSWPHPGYKKPYFPIRYIALDTRSSIYKEGDIHEVQLGWFYNQLVDAYIKNQYVIIFAHHHPKKVLWWLCRSNATDFRKILRSFPNIVAYFYGHEHRNEEYYHQSAKKSKVKKHSYGSFMLIQTGSPIDFPQSARNVEIFIPKERKQWPQEVILRWRHVRPKGNASKEGRLLNAYFKAGLRGAKKDYNREHKFKPIDSIREWVEGNERDEGHLKAGKATVDVLEKKKGVLTLLDIFEKERVKEINRRRKAFGLEELSKEEIPVGSPKGKSEKHK